MAETRFKLQDPGYGEFADIGRRLKWRCLEPSDAGSAASDQRVSEIATE